ncbi:MAG: hypothetical protein ACKO7R_14430 [Pseudanabaena sp.]
MDTILVPMERDYSSRKSYKNTDYNRNQSIINLSVASGEYMIKNLSNATIQNSNFEITKQHLFEIDNTDTDSEEVEDEWGAIRPTKYAWKLSLELLQQIFNQISTNFPLGFASLEENGGIELIWKNYLTKNEVRVSIPPNQNIDMTLYVRDIGNGKSEFYASSSFYQVVKALQFLHQ